MKRKKTMLFDILLRNLIFYSPSKDDGTGDPDPDEDDDEDDDVDDEDEDEDDVDPLEEFEDWLAEQPDDVQKVYAKQTSGLLNALRSERVSVKELKKMAPMYAKLKEDDDKRKRDAQTETERLESDVKTATDETAGAVAALEKERKRFAIVIEATKMGFIDPDGDPLELGDLDTVVIDDDGKVTGTKKMLKVLAKEKPYLLKSDDDDDEPIGNDTRHKRRRKKKKTETTPAKVGVTY